MNQAYYDAVVKMEEADVNPEYLVGWQSGYLVTPLREEQRLSENYETGYEHGAAKDTESYKDFCS